MTRKVRPVLIEVNVAKVGAAHAADDPPEVRMLLDTLAATRDVGRLQEIAHVLVRFGFYDVVDRLGLAGALARAGHVLHAPRIESSARHAAPVRLREALETLGPTFVKLGQILSTRVDLLPPEFTGELERLQNQGARVPWPEIEARLEREWGGAIADVFGDVEHEPLAAASIAQVHRGRLRDGRAVAIKIRRPGIRGKIASDLRLLERVARAVEAHSPEFARYRPRDIVHHFRASIERELDLAAECQQAERIAAALSRLPDIRVPSVHWEWTTPAVNVQEFFDGPPLQVLLEPGVAAARGADLPTIARTGAEAILQMVFVDGFFHADPHGANVLHLGGNRIGLIDCGMVGHLSSERRRQLVRLLRALVEREPEQAAAVIVEWAGDVGVDTPALIDDLGTFLDRYHGTPLSRIRLGEMLAEVAALIRRHGLALPPDLAMVVKVFITLEGLGRRLDPGFDMVSAAAPFVRRLRRARLRPRAVGRRVESLLAEAADVLSGLPRQLRRIVASAADGRLRLHVDVDALRTFGDQVGRSANRLSMSLVIAALIIGSSIVMTIDGGPTLFGLPFFGLAGFVGAVFGGTWLLVSILRTGGGR